MAMTPAQRHRARVLAEQQAEQAAVQDPHGPMQGSEHELMLAQLYAHMRALKGIQSVEKKIEAKRSMLADFDAYVDAVLCADAGLQDPVITTVLVWHLDVGNLARALALADYALRHALSLPDQYQRTLPTLLLDEVSDAVIKGAVSGEAALQALGAVGDLTEGRDAHDQARAKLHKAIGWALMGKHATHDLSADAIKQLSVPTAELALGHLRRAVGLHTQIGVKKDVERLERRLKELAADAP